MLYKFQMPKRLSGKQVLELLFALPSSDSDSDVEADYGASDELQHLDTADNSGRASSDPGQPQTTSTEQLCRDRRGGVGVRAQLRTSDVQTAGASPDPGQPQRTSGEQLSDVDTDDSVNLQNSDESDQDDTGWGDSVSQFGMQFYDKAPYVRSPVDNRAKERDYFRLLFSNDIVENLVEQTNLHATQPKTKTVLCRGTRVHKTLPCQN